MSKIILLTGGSGFVGRNIIPILRGEGFIVKALARSEKSALAVEKYGAIPVRGDLTDEASLHIAAMGCDLVIHAAAHMEFWGDKAPFFQVNVLGTQHILRAAAAVGVKKFIYIGAASVINGQEVYEKDETYIPAQLPKDYYSLTKALAEQAVVEAHSPHFETVVLRPPAIWGPHNHSTEMMIDRVKSGNWIWIGGGNHRLSTIHVFNLAQAIIAAVEKGGNGEIYFVTDGEQRPIKELFGQMFERYGVSAGERSLSRGLALRMAKLIQFIWTTFRLKSSPPIVPVMIYLMGTEFSVSDQKARRELGYQNAISIEEGLHTLG
ncbi:MAG: NAD-dependent epimerase/dehydratase family protein [Bacteroidota bacterium]